MEGSISETRINLPTQIPHLASNSVQQELRRYESTGTTKSWRAAATIGKAGCLTAIGRIHSRMSRQGLEMPYQDLAEKSIR